MIRDSLDNWIDPSLTVPTEEPNFIQESIEEFRGKYRQSVYEAYPDHTSSHSVLLSDIEQFLSQKLEEAMSRSHLETLNRVTEECEEHRQGYIDQGRKEIEEEIVRIVAGLDSEHYKHL